MSDDPLTFSLVFTIPRMASAYRRHPDGGARLVVDIEESCVPASNAMLDLMVKRAGTTFAAVVVVVAQEIEENRTNGRESTETQAQRRTAKRPTDVASG